MAGSTILTIRDVRLQFGGVKALNGINIEVKEGEFLGVIGPNGAGKTTLFNVITGVLRPNEGSVQFDGQELTTLAPDVICRLGIARTYQRVRSFPRLSVLQNVMVPIVNRNRPAVSNDAAYEIARGLLKRVGLWESANIDANRLNLFQRKKIELARALGAGARIIMLDEVMAGLNAVEADTASDLLRSLKAEHAFTVVCIEHLMRIIMKVSDRIVVLDRGAVLATGTPNEIADNRQVQSAYLGTEYA
jgi:ABC-type branched-subunit amino acid transport system ATPase component